MDKSDRILVTGARGLVGSAVVAHLRVEGFSNVMEINRETCDLLSLDRTRAVFEWFCPAHVFHAAGRVYGMGGNMAHQAQSYMENTLINIHVIDAAHRVGVNKITVMGSNAIYPGLPRLPLREEDIFDGRPHDSESGYAHAKRGMLAMLEAYEHSYGMQWAYVVACNLFGPRDRFDPVNGHVVPSLIHKFGEARKTGAQVIVWGTGLARRDFIYIDDVARAAMLIMEKVRGPINIGGGSRRIGEIVDAISSITGVTNIAWDRSMTDGQSCREADLRRIRSLGFMPRYTIEEGLRMTWEWYLEHRR